MDMLLSSFSDRDEPLCRPWWGLLMPDEAYVALVRDIEVERGRMTAHEAVCAERYKGIINSLERMEKGINGLNAKVAKQPQVLNAWIVRGLVGVLVIAMGLVSWEAKQLYDEVKPAAHAQPWWQVTTGGSQP
jgi:hypothetical protein